MSLADLVNQLIAETWGTAGGWLPGADSDLYVFRPELVLCATIFLLLLLRMHRVTRKIDSGWVALAGAVVGLLCASPWTQLSLDAPVEMAGRTTSEIFGGMLVYDGFGVFIRSFLFVFLVLFVLLTRLTRIPDKEDAAEFHALVFGATLGMCLMATANSLVMVFVAVEIASVPSYAMAGMLRFGAERESRRASEAALKYAVYGAGAAGVMLYGISLLAGVANTMHLPTMAHQLALRAQDGTLGGEASMVLVLGGLMVMVGLAFKLSAVPFHFWCPDVFEGATAEVNAFLSVASKAAALALLVRVSLGLGYVPTSTLEELESKSPGATALVQAELPQTPQGNANWSVADEQPTTSTSDSQGESGEKGPEGEEGDTTGKDTAGKETTGKETAHNATAAKGMADEDPTAESASLTAQSLNAALAPVRNFSAALISLFAIITCTFGNLAAYGQTNIKRLLAYSTIAHAGYMMMAVPAALAMAGTDPVGGQNAIAALAVYVGIYLFMNLGAFAVVALIRDRTGKEEIADYGGLIRRAPGIAVCLSLILFSLVGLPPLAGFIGKFAIFAALANGYASTGAGHLILLLCVGGVNTVISLFYYLRVVKVMTIDPEPEDRIPLEVSDVSLPAAYLWLVTLPILLLIIVWNGLNEWALAAAQNLLA